MINNNLKEINMKIENACKKVGRDPSEITLVAVSKTKPVSMINQAINCKVMDFGENKVQELNEKYDLVQGKVNWHFIGHLQTNKIKYIIDKVSLIHSVDSYKLAACINEEGKKRGIISSILIQINVANEDTKFGISEDEVHPLIEQVSKLSNIKVEGLMTIPPFVDNSEENRKYFSKLNEICIDIKSKNVDNVNMNILSMGMTDDYEVAIEEGATIIRIGNGIFGERK